MEKVRILSAEAIRAALPMDRAIAAMREAFGLLARGEVTIPPRTVLSPSGGRGTTLVMPGRVPLRYGRGMKLVSVYPENAGRGLPVVQGIVVLLDDETGTPAAVLDGTALTAIRTGAASGLATDLLASAGARRVAILGSGAQARTQLEAVCTVRRIESVRVWSRTRAHAERFAEEMRDRAPVPAAVSVAATPAEAVADADIVCTATGAPTPVLRAVDVPDGAHVNAVGSFTREMTEFEPELLRDAFVVVDQRDAALAEAGEVIAAVQAGFLGEEDLMELGELVTGARAAAQRASRVSVFKSVGLAVQDLVAGAWAVDHAWRDWSAPGTL